VEHVGRRGDVLTRRSGTQGDESGAVLVITALLLVVFLGFAALAVDAANAWSTRRQVQTAADLSSLAAVQAIPRTLLDVMNAEVASTGADFVATNAPGAGASVGAATAGPSCDARPAQFTRPCHTNVAIDVSDASDNSFAPAIGAGDTVAVDAHAEAQIDIEYPAMKLFPIGVNSATGQRLRCIAQGAPIPGPPLIPQCAIIPLPLPIPNPLPEPLPNPIPVGNNDVRLLAMRRFDLGCDADDTNVVATTNANIVNGVDHLVDEDLAAPLMRELDACQRGHELSLPNQFQIINSPVVGVDGIRSVTGGGQQLWNYLTPASSGLCHPLIYTGIVHPDPAVVFAVKSFLLNACLSGTLGSSPVFTLPASSPRMGWAIDQSGNRVQGYVPVWIHSLVDGFLTPQSSSPTGFSIFVLDASWLSASLTEVDPGGLDNLSFKLVD
jgi:Flp pilus assembly protein TadG